MKSKMQKIISLLLLVLVMGLGFQSLIYILNLNEPGLFWKTAVNIWLFLVLYIALIYDLHFKVPGSWARATKKHISVANAVRRQLSVFFSSFFDRVRHLLELSFWRHWLNYLILPTLIFWASAVVFYVNFGFYSIQQTVALFSLGALCLNFWFLKEIFIRRKEVVDSDIFVTLSVVKIYAVTLVYAAALAIIRRYCLDPKYFAFGIFALTFLFIYQALFQHRLVNLKNLCVNFCISFIMGLSGYFLIIFWGHNYFTGAVFLAVFYNLMWGIFHYKLDKALNFKVFAEIWIISLLIASMVFSVTNFKAKLLDGCRYKISL